MAERHRSQWARLLGELVIIRACSNEDAPHLLGRSLRAATSARRHFPVAQRI